MLGLGLGINRGFLSVGGAVAPSYTPPLDTYTGATAAYSVRKLSSTYSGSCIEAYRVSDGATQDIGFDADGLIDTAAIATFGGGSVVGVRTWYDQSGNALDAVQTTAANQMQIYSGAAVITKNDKPALQHGTVNGGLDITGYTGGTNATVLAVMADTVTEAIPVISSASGAPFLFRSQISQSNLAYRGFGTSPNSFLNGVEDTFLTNGEVFAAFGSAQGLVIGIGSTSSWTGSTFYLGWSRAQLFQEVIFWNSDQDAAGNINGINTNVNSYYQIANLPASSSGLLYDYPDAAAAYSVRSLSNNAVKCMRVRRDNDDEELDIGFDANGDLDTAAIATHCEANNGYVTRWYDQSGNSNNATQATKASQPQIYNGTAVITENGQPAVKFDGSSDHFDITWTQTASDYSLHAVTQNSATESFLFDSDVGRLVFDGRAPTAGVYFDGAWRGTKHSGTTQQLQSIYAIAPSSGQSYLNGSQINSGLSYTQKAIGGTSTHLGAEKGGGSFLINGSIQEWILYASDQTSNRTAIETDINTYYSIYT